jgi:hypothetical protein
LKTAFSSHTYAGLNKQAGRERESSTIFFCRLHNAAGRSEWFIEQDGLFCGIELNSEKQHHCLSLFMSVVEKLIFVTFLWVLLLMKNFTVNTTIYL